MLWVRLRPNHERGFRICTQLQTVNSGDERPRSGRACTQTASTYKPDGADAPLFVLCGTFPLWTPARCSSADPPCTVPSLGNRAARSATYACLRHRCCKRKRNSLNRWRLFARPGAAQLAVTRLSVVVPQIALGLQDQDFQGLILGSEAFSLGLVSGSVWADSGFLIKSGRDSANCNDSWLSLQPTEMKRFSFITSTLKP